MLGKRSLIKLGGGAKWRIEGSKSDAEKFTSTSSLHFGNSAGTQPVKGEFASDVWEICVMVQCKNTSIISRILGRGTQ